MESKGYAAAATKPRNLDQGSTSIGAGMASAQLPEQQQDMVSVHTTKGASIRP